MPNFELTPTNENVDRLISRFEDRRIKPEKEFADLYYEYGDDMARTEQIGAVYDEQHAEVKLGKAAEALVFSELLKHEAGQHFDIRPTSHYDDYFHGVDLLIEPRNAPLQSLASIDITINQEDIKGTHRSSGQYAEERPVGLEKKLLRSRAYTDRLANLDATHARDLSAWIGSGGLHEKKTADNKRYFSEAERLFLMKYYTAPDSSNEPNKPGFVIGGPQAVISIDSVFVNKALQGNKSAATTIGDLALLEFVSCVQAEQEYLDSIVKHKKDRNIFFDTHYSKVRSWSHIFDKPEIGGLVGDILKRNQGNREFREQLAYYAQTFNKLKMDSR